MDTAIVSYQRFTDMPRDVYNACCQMGYVGGWSRGHLRALARKERNNCDQLKYKLTSCLVMYVGDAIVGWAALYTDTEYGCLNMSVWVKRCHRNKGYGATLVKDAFKRWRHRRPQVFRSVELMWTELSKR